MMPTKNNRYVISLMFMSQPRVAIETIDLQKKGKKIGIIDWNFKINMNYQQFFEILRPKIKVSKIKAMVFSIHEYTTFKNFEDAMAFRSYARDFAEANGIFPHFTTATTIQIFAALSQTKSIVEDGQSITVIKDGENGLIAGTVIRKNNAYYYHGAIQMPDTCMKEAWGASSKIIYFHESSLPSRTFKKLMENNKDVEFVICKSKFAKDFGSSIVGHVLHAMGEKLSPYFFVNHCSSGFRLLLSQNSDDELQDQQDLLIDQHIFSHLPYEESVVIDIQPPMRCVRLLSTCPLDYICRIDLSDFKTKKIKVTLKIDLNCSYDLKAEPFTDEIDEQMAKMAIAENPKVRIIFTKPNFSVMLNGKILGDVDGSVLIPAYIAFTQAAKPIIGKVAKNAYKTNPKAVVFDLLQICSSHTGDLIPYEEFKVVKQSADTVMVEVETAKGRRSFTMPFLLSLILRQGLQLAKLQTAEQKIAELDIQLNFTANETLKKNFVEAGKLLKVTIVFV